MAAPSRRRNRNPIRNALSTATTYHRVVTTPPADHLEVEWQFEAPDLERVAAWLTEANVPGYIVTALKTKEVRDTYFDTADWRLFRGGFTCRIRHQPDGNELTLKSMAAATDGLRSRREMNEVLPADVSRPEQGAGPCARAVRLMAGRRHVEALFTLQQHRRIYALDDLYGRLGELAVDETAVEGTERVFRRVELEVMPGAVQRAERFRGVLTAVGSLTPAGLSKFQAAMAACGLKAVPTEATLGSTDIRSNMATGDVAFAVLRKHFATFLANEPGTRLGEDIEALHDMRVATRRLRAAMQAFAPWLPQRVLRFRVELGHIAAALGEVRDLDVFLERLDEWESEDPEHAAALAAIGVVLRERRESARGRMLAVLDRVRYDVFVERFAAWLRTGSPRSFAPGREPIVAVAPGLVRKRYRRVRRMGDAIGRESPPDDYHALRIEGKKLRYALEFVAPVYGAPASDFARRLTALQDVLGLHQDAYVAIDMLSEIAATNARRLGPETLLAMGAVQHRYRQHAVELRAQFREVYRPLRDQWLLLQKVMAAAEPRGEGAVV
jgi:triphosphatase